MPRWFGEYDVPCLAERGSNVPCLAEGGSNVPCLAEGGV